MIWISSAFISCSVFRGRCIGLNTGTFPLLLLIWRWMICMNQYICSPVFTAHKEHCREVFYSQWYRYQPLSYRSTALNICSKQTDTSLDIGRNKLQNWPRVVSLTTRLDIGRNKLQKQPRVLSVTTRLLIRPWRSIGHVLSYDRFLSNFQLLLVVWSMSYLLSFVAMFIELLTFQTCLPL